MRSSKPSPLTSPAEETDKPSSVAGVLAVDDEAAVAARDRGEVDLRREAAGLAEHHVAVACTSRVCCRGRRRQIVPR